MPAEQLPRDLRPMLAVPGSLPDRPGWAYEFKWDGARALVAVSGGRVSVYSRRGTPVTVAYPELAELATAVSATVLLDGEIVSLDRAGRPDFAALQRRMHVADATAARRLAGQAPVSFFAFDLLHLDGRSTRGRGYTQRRTALEEVIGPDVGCPVPPSFDDGPAVLEAARQRGLEGVVAKRLDSPYLAGQRSAAWVKVKLTRHQEVVIVGWRTGLGRRAGQLGALLVAVPDGAALRYAGRVGTGFTEEGLARLATRLRPLEIPGCPLAAPPPDAQAGDVHWVRPELVGEVAYTEWTRKALLRHPSWRGLRPDKRPQEVLVER
jgi:bifunctional non-homologous end joining protein LigD